MRVDRPPPGEQLNTGDVTEARLAASVIVLRDRASAGAGIEVLLVERNPEASFMGGAWVFPGGSVHTDDADPAHAAVRELAEEAGLSNVEPGELVPFSRWITPLEVTVRFDTWFFVVRAPDDQEPAPDGSECVDVRWIEPSTALAAGRSDELFLVFPTIKHLEQLAELDSVDQALSVARDREVEPILPRVVTRDGAGHVLLPGEPGYEG